MAATARSPPVVAGRARGGFPPAASAAGPLEAPGPRRAGGRFSSFASRARHLGVLQRRRARGCPRGGQRGGVAGPGRCRLDAAMGARAGCRLSAFGLAPGRAARNPTRQRHGARWRASASGQLPVEGLMRASGLPGAQSSTPAGRGDRSCAHAWNARQHQGSRQQAAPRRRHGRADTPSLQAPEQALHTAHWRARQPAHFLGRAKLQAAQQPFEQPRRPRVEILRPGIPPATPVNSFRVPDRPSPPLRDDDKVRRQGAALDQGPQQGAATGSSGAEQPNSAAAGPLARREWSAARSGRQNPEPPAGGGCGGQTSSSVAAVAAGGERAEGVRVCALLGSGGSDVQLEHPAYAHRRAAAAWGVLPTALCVRLLAACRTGTMCLSWART